MKSAKQAKNRILQLEKRRIKNENKFIDLTLTQKVAPLGRRLMDQNLAIVYEMKGIYWMLELHNKNKSNKPKKRKNGKNKKSDNR